jgi:hypothetical protein
MATIKQLEKDIQDIRERNKKVEANKSWETSLSRKLIISILTYLTMVIFFFFAKLPSPFVNAIAPSLAFVLSTLTLSFFKNLWLRFHKKNSN